MRELPEKIGDYDVVRELGRGAMGVVYLARHPALGREMALKVMAPELARDPEFMERFRREGEAAARLRHPNIVGVFDFATRDGLSFIAMEYLGATTLKDVLEQHGQQPVERACQMMEELLSALALAHAKGIVHRDIKPANIMLSDEGAVALTDFSIAHMKEASKLTQTGAIVGTPEYMAPEQFDGKWDQRSDLYAAGIVFYELLTGFSPFRSQTMTEVMRKQLLTVPDPPHLVDFTIPEALSAVVSRALEKAPEARFQSAQEMAEAVKRARATSAAATTGTGAETAATATETPGTATGTPGTAAAMAGTAAETPGTAAETAGTAAATAGTATATAGTGATGTTPATTTSEETAPQPSAAAPTGQPQRESAAPDSTPNQAARSWALGAAALAGVALIVMGLAKGDPPAPPAVAAASASPAEPASPAPPPQPSGKSTPSAPAPISDDLQDQLPEYEDAPLDQLDDLDDLDAPGFPLSGIILPGVGLDEIALTTDSATVLETWGPPAIRKKGQGVTSWIYHNTSGSAMVTLRDRDDQVVMLAINNPDYSVMANPNLRTGQSHQTVLANFQGQLTTRTDNFLDYRGQGVLFCFENGLCTNIVIYLPGTEPHLKYI